MNNIYLKMLTPYSNPVMDIIVNFIFEKQGVNHGQWGI